jgi:DNA-binding ferritin-like protein (Dps family)
MWIDKLVGDLADKKNYLEYKARVKRLPAGYREAAKALERYLTYTGPSDDSKALIAMLDDLAELFEQSVADATPIRTLVGDDPAEFAETFLDNYSGGSWIRKERARLTESIARAIEEQDS